MDRTTPPTHRHAQSLPLADAFRDQFSDEDIDRIVADHGICFRNRLFTPAVTVRTFFNQVFHAGASCRNAVIRLYAARLPTTRPDIAPLALHTGSYCKARQRLPEVVITQLGRLVADRAEAAAKPWNWNGHPVKIVDGSTVSMPDTPANQEAFPQPKNQTPGVGFPLARLLLIVSLATGCVRRMALAPKVGKGQGEGSLLAGMLDEFNPNDLVMGDSLFSSYWLLASLSARGVHDVGDLSSHRRADYRTGQRLGPTDRLVIWHKPPKKPPGLSHDEWDALPETVTVRRMRVAVDRPGFRPKVLHLVTTLLDAQRYPKADVATRYRRRWQIERHLRTLKADGEMGIVRCKNPSMVRKEIAMHVLVFNAVRAVMVTAGIGVNRQPSRLSFTAAREAIEAFAPQLADPALRERALAAMLE